jgi:hypothetical protein
MLRKVSLALVVLASFAAVPAVAGAHHKPVQHPTTNPVALAVSLGERYWGNVPCHGAIPVISAAPANDSTMWTYMVATPAQERALASCPIYTSDEEWPNWYADDLNFEEFCKGITHELGHLEGYPDEGAKPGTVQYELPGLARVPPCEHYRLRYGRHIFER